MRRVEPGVEDFAANAVAVIALDGFDVVRPAVLAGVVHVLLVRAQRSTKCFVPGDYLPELRGESGMQHELAGIDHVHGPADVFDAWPPRAVF